MIECHTFSTKALVAYFGLILYVSSVGVIDKTCVVSNMLV